MTSSPSHLQPRNDTADRYNEEGILHFQKFSTEKAIVSFSKALQASLHSMSAVGNEAGQIHRASVVASETLIEASLAHCCCENAGAIIMSEEISKSYEDCLPQDDTIVLFNRMLRISALKESRAGTSCRARIQLTTALIMYNIGLVHHVQGLKKGQSEVLKKALSWYNMSLKAFLSDGNSRDTPCQRANALIPMAVLNNMGHIHATFCNFPAVVSCTRALSMRLSSLGPKIHRETEIVSQDDNLIFLMNVWFLNRPIILSPAA